MAVIPSFWPSLHFFLIKHIAFRDALEQRRIKTWHRCHVLIRRCITSYRDNGTMPCNHWRSKIWQLYHILTVIRCHPDVYVMLLQKNDGKNMTQLTCFFPSLILIVSQCRYNSIEVVSVKNMVGVPWFWPSLLYFFTVFVSIL